MPNFKRKFLGLLLPVMGIAALTSCNFLSEESAKSDQNEESINSRSQVDNGFDSFDFSFSDDTFKPFEPASTQPDNTKVEDQSAPIDSNPVEEQEAPQETDRGGNTQEEIEDEVEDISELFNLTLNKTEVELDAGKEREFMKVSDSLQGNLYSAFDQVSDITCTYTEAVRYSYNDLTVKWSIPAEDANYFSVNVVSNTSGTSTAVVSATKESRLSTLTVSVVLKSNENYILASSECELRSVLTHAYWVDNYSKFFLAGEDITNYGDAYTARFYNKVYSEDEDIVIPSKVNINGTIRPLARLVGLAKADGSDKLNGLNYATCRNLYIPNSVIQFSGYALAYVKPTKKVVFGDGEHNILFCTDSSLYYQGQGSTDGGFFYNQLINGNIEVSLPYNSYIQGVTEKATSHGTMSLISDVSFPYLVNQNNSKTTLFKKI